MKKEYIYSAKIINIVDGDTVDVIIDLGFKISLNKRIRLEGIDTPEVYGVKKYSEEYNKGKLSSDYLKYLLPIESNVTIKTYKNNIGKYGRYLAKIYKKDLDKSINDIMLEKGYATKYNG